MTTCSDYIESKYDSEMCKLLHDLYDIRDAELINKNTPAVKNLDKQIDRIWNIDVTKYDRYIYILKHKVTLKDLTPDSCVSSMDIIQFELNRRDLKKLKKQRDDLIEEWIYLRDMLSIKIETYKRNKENC